MALYVDEVTVTLTGEQAAAVWKAVDRMAATHPDGPYRAQLDRLCNLVGTAVKDATLAAESEKRGHRALAAAQEDPETLGRLLRALPDPDDDETGIYDIDDEDAA